MKIRIAAAAVLAFITLTACSSSTDGKGGSLDAFNTAGGSTSQSAPMTTTPTDTNTGSVDSTTPDPGTSETGNSGGTSSDFCTELQQELTKVGDLGSSMSDPSKAKVAIQQMADVFKKLAGDAPAEVKPALQDLADVMAAAAKYLNDPSSGSASAMTDLTSKLPEDMQKLTAYATEHCS